MTDLEQIPFHYGCNLPATFRLDTSSQCSCGITDNKLPVEKSQVIVFASNTAIEKLLETKYCSCCRNTKGCVGPNKGKYGVFDWNNRIAFSHRLFDSFTSQFTRSETPFYSYHQTIMDNYKYERSPYPLCILCTFVLAYFVYLRLQQIGTWMECQKCGRNPQAVIVDGIGLGVPKHYISTLKLPTQYNKSRGHIIVPLNSTTATGFIVGQWREFGNGWGIRFQILQVGYSTDSKLKPTYTPPANFSAFSPTYSQIASFVKCIRMYFDFSNCVPYFPR